MYKNMKNLVETPYAKINHNDLVLCQKEFNNKRLVFNLNLFY